MPEFWPWIPIVAVAQTFLNGSSASFSLQLGMLTSVLLRESCSCRQRNYTSASQRRFRKKSFQLCGSAGT